MKKALISLSLLVGITMCAPAHAQLEESAESVKCLADNIYWEARNQSRVSHMAVAFVVKNRVIDKRFPNTICEVVYQGPTRKSWKNPSISYPVRNRCQFSWYCDGKSDEIPEKDKELYEDIKFFASAFLVKHKYLIDFTEGATHYHAYYVKPAWAKTKIRTAKIEDHIFYRWEDAN